MTEHDDKFDDWLGRHRVEPLSPAPGVYDRIVRTARRRRTVRATAAGAAVAVMLTGITGVVHRIATGPAPAVPSGASASPTRSSAVPPDPQSPSPSLASADPPSSSATGAPARSSRCRAGELKVTAQTAPGGGAAGGGYEVL
jgi:hypothetical protein